MHGRQLLRFVHHDVPEGPGAVGAGTLGSGQPRLPLLVLVHQLFGGDEDVHPGRFHVDQGLLGIGKVAGTVLFLLRQAPPGSGVKLAEQFGGLIQQRDVGLSPGRTGRTEQQRTFLGAQVRRARLEDRGFAQQLPHKLLRGHRHPAQVQGDPDVPGGADVLGQVGPVSVVADVARFHQLSHLLGQFTEQDLDEGNAGLVVRLARGAGPFLGPAHLPGREDQLAAVHLQDPVCRRNTLPVGYRVGHHLGHVQPAFDGGDGGIRFGNGGDARQ